MKIRKLFKFEMAHIVREAYSRRCAMNIHGHSYKVEVVFEGSEDEIVLDKAGMIKDFGEIKHFINPFLDRFDHSCMLWKRDNNTEEIEFFLRNYERVIVADFNSTAENQARYFYHEITRILKENDIDDIFVSQVIVHETDTGYASYNMKDFLVDDFEYNVDFSVGILNEVK